MTAELIRQICALSIFCGAAMSLTPEGGVKRILAILCTAALMVTVLGALRSIDYEDYALEISRYREQEKSFLEQSTEMNERLNRLVIEEEYETYIMDKAREYGLAVERAEVDLRWSTDGLWVPESADIVCRATEEQRSLLTGIIQAELGIAAEKQRWSEDE